MEGNPLPDTILTASRIGPTELLSYLRSLLEDFESLYEAKLILVGEGGVGKSSLVAALINKPFVENRETTHGIEMCSLSAPIPGSSDVLRLNVWDFGGQPVYRITHQFFYSKRSLYLLLWSPRRGAELCDVEGWLKRIRLRVGGAARILIIATHSETGDRVARIDKDVLQRDYGETIAGFADVDSKTGAGIKQLKELIATTARTLPQMGTRFSLRWKQSRDQVLNLKSTRIGYDDFRAICSECGMDRSATRTLAELMHDLGYIVYYGDDEGLREEVILNPEWLTKAIGFVLEDPVTNRERGVLDHRRLRTIWSDRRPDRQHYAPELHPYFLRLMEKYDASYRLEGGQSSLVAQLVPSTRPKLPWTEAEPVSTANGGAEISLICQLEEDPPGLIPWLIVRTHHFSTRPRLHWQRGMFLQYASHGTALIELRGRELHVLVRGAWPNYFMDILRYTINRLIEERWAGLAVTFSVPCPTRRAGHEPCRGRFPLVTLHKLKSKFDVIPCLTCSKEVDIDALLVGFKPPEVKREIDRLARAVTAQGNALARLESENAARFRAVLRAMNAETRECPHLFTLIPDESGWTPERIGSARYRLTLWCEMPNEQHPICVKGGENPGEYVIDRASPWLVRIAPYARFVANILRTVLPIAAPAIQVLGGQTPITSLKNDFDLMDKVATTLLKDKLVARGGPGLSSGATVSEAEGASLRELHALLQETDPTFYWGGLRRTLTPTGDYLWLCPEHYSRFDPGLPVFEAVE